MVPMDQIANLSYLIGGQRLQITIFFMVVKMQCKTGGSKKSSAWQQLSDEIKKQGIVWKTSCWDEDQQDGRRTLEDI
jgi:hypothetical protein